MNCVETSFSRWSRNFCHFFSFIIWNVHRASSCWWRCFICNQSLRPILLKTRSSEGSLQPQNNDSVHRHNPKFGQNVEDYQPDDGVGHPNRFDSLQKVFFFINYVTCWFYLEVWLPWVIATLTRGWGGWVVTFNLKTNSSLCCCCKSGATTRKGPHLTWKKDFHQQVGWGTRLGNDEEKSTSAVMNAKNWGTLSPMPMTKLAIMCNIKLRLFWDKGRDTIMNILTLSVSEKTFT